MRIALLPSAYAPAVGGVEELTHRLAAQLTLEGDAVEVWTNRHPASLPRAELVEGVQVRRFGFAMPSSRPRQLTGFPLAAGGTLRELRRAARALRPDVLHVQCFSGNGVYAAALSALTRTPLVVSLQGETVMDDHDIYEHSASLRTGLRRGLRRAAAVTGCSRFVLDDAVRRFGLPAGAGTVVPNGVDLRDRPAREPLDVPFASFVFAVGRFVDKKGFDLLLDAFERIAGEHPGVGLVIGGDGDARGPLTERVREAGLEDRVSLPGRLSRDQVAWAMANATVFVLPSRVEPFGIVVLEALRGGRPVVVSGRGGAPEIVRDEEHGLVVDPCDTSALAAAIARLLDDAALRERLSGAAASRAADFGWEHITARYREVYAGVT